MKLLVTGGAGFIGSAVVRRGIRAGHTIVNLDKLTYAGSLTNVAEVAESQLYTFEQADICDRKAVNRRKPCRPLHRPPGGVHRDEYPRHLHDAGGRPSLLDRER